MPVISSKSPNEERPIKFNFSSKLSSINSATVSVSVVSGTDASPSDILSGSPIITGGSVIQYIKGGLVDVVYSIKVLATYTSSEGTTKLELNAQLPVKPSQ